MIPPPKRAAAVCNYASILNSLLHETRVQISVLLSIQEESDDQNGFHDEGSIWQVWNTIQTLTNYHPRLSVALQISKDLPPKEFFRKWFAEPVKILLLSADIFLSNNMGYPVLPKAHQRLLSSFMKVFSLQTYLTIV